MNSKENARASTAARERETHRPPEVSIYDRTTAALEEFDERKELDENVSARENHQGLELVGEEERIGQREHPIQSIEVLRIAEIAGVTLESYHETPAASGDDELKWVDNFGEHEAEKDDADGLSKVDETASFGDL